VKQKRNKIKGLIFVVSGPSGSGKTTLLAGLLKDRAIKKVLVKSISLATRPRRPAEKNSSDYFFISQRQFIEKRRAKKILEWTKYLGYYYATPKDFAERQLKKGRSIILSLDLRGTLRVKKLYPGNTVTIFIAPPSLEVLRKRIEGRCHKTGKTEIRQRLGLAKRELLASGHYDYCLMNRNLRRAVRDLREIILKEINIFNNKA
jgi:guanylate kinase